MDARAWDERYAGSEFLWTAEPNRFIVGEVSDLEPGRALDLACGEGRNAVWLAQGGWRVTGVDFSDVAIGKARRLADARDVDVEWVVADLLEWRPDAGRADLVLWLYLHLAPEERRTVLGRAVEALAPGGTLLAVGHHVDNIEHGYGGPPVPGILLAPDEFVDDLRAIERAAGVALVIERADRVDRPVDTDEGPRTAIDALVRARRL